METTVQAICFQICREFSEILDYFISEFSKYFLSSIFGNLKNEENKVPYSFQYAPRALRLVILGGAYLFQYLLQGSTQKFMILANFRLIPNHIFISVC